MKRTPEGKGASPQCEDGYTKVANEILEALSRVKLSPYEWRVLMFIIRKTYGWQKKTDLIPLSQIALGTGILKGNASRTLKSLISKQIVIRTDNKRIGFSKNYTQWLSVAITPKVISSDNGVISSDNKRLSAETPQKKRKKPSQKKEGFFDYAERLRQRFPLVDFEGEFEKFWLFYTQGDKATNNPSLALLKWMKNAEKWRIEREPQRKSNKPFNCGDCGRGFDIEEELTQHLWSCRR